MTCQNYKDLMMAYLDNELDDEQKQSFEKHLETCRDCKQEVEGFSQLKTLTDEVTLVEPEDRVWQQYWNNIYNRTERCLGWIIFSLASILLLIYCGFKLIEDVIKDPEVSLLLKVGLVGLIAGFSILLVSVLRERLYIRKKERYKDVMR